MLTDMRKHRFPQQELAERLVKALEDSRVTQADLARACKVTDQAVHGWVTNGRIGKPHFATICGLTGKPLEFFFVGLKTWRRAAAIAYVILVPLVFALASSNCVLCNIAQRLLRLAGGLCHDIRIAPIPA